MFCCVLFVVGIGWVTWTQALVCALLQIAALGCQNERFCDILDSAAFKLLPERVFETCWFNSVVFTGCTAVLCLSWAVLAELTCFCCSLSSFFAFPYSTFLRNDDLPSLFLWMWCIIECFSILICSFTGTISMVVQFCMGVVLCRSDTGKRSFPW